MSGIVCPIRGGAASRPTIAKAIEVAEETGLPIFFLFVLNLDFLMHTTHIQTGTISRELRELGEFILLAAETKAEAAGVTAHGVIREGQVVRTEIIELSQEVDADYVVMGVPQEARDENVFTPALLEELGLVLAQETGATVIFSEGEGV